MTTTTQINHTVLEGNLYAETDGINVSESSDKFMESLKSALQAEFPAAKITITLLGATQGAPPSPSISLESADGDGIFDDYYEENLALDRINEIESAVWEKFDWIVESSN